MRYTRSQRFCYVQVSLAELPVVRDRSRDCQLHLDAKMTSTRWHPVNANYRVSARWDYLWDRTVNRCEGQADSKVRPLKEHFHRNWFITQVEQLDTNLGWFSCARWVWPDMDL